MLVDAVVIRDWIGKTYPGHAVFVFGQSLGTGPAVFYLKKKGGHHGA